MTADQGPENPGSAGPGRDRSPERAGKELDRRRRDLDSALAARRPAPTAEDGAKTGGMAGFGNALRLSSEFIAGILVGAGIGWLIDQLAGTTPFGLIVFLLLGFAAGVLNVLRTAGLVAQPKIGGPPDRDGSLK